MSQPFEFEVPLTPAALRARLAAAMEPVPYLGGLKAPPPHVQFWGRIDAQRLSLRLPERGRNSFRAWLHGSLTPTAAGTRITARATGFGFAMILLTAWVILVGSWGVDAYRRGDGQTALALSGLLAFGLWIGIVGWSTFRSQAEELEQRLRRLLGHD